MRRLKWARVRGQLRIRVRAMAWIARLSARSPPRLSPVPDRSAAAGRHGAGAAEGGEYGFATAAAGVGEGDDGLRGADRPDAIAAGQAGGDVIPDGQQVEPVRRVGFIRLERVQCWTDDWGLG